jgi:hypothetical protein
MSEPNNTAPIEGGTRKQKGPYRNSRRKILRVVLNASRSTQEYIVRELIKAHKKQKVDRKRAIGILNAIAAKHARKLGVKVARVCLKK